MTAPLNIQVTVSRNYNEHSAITAKHVCDA